MTVLLCVALLAFSRPAVARPDPQARVETAIAHWLAERGLIEQVTGISAYVSFNDASRAGVCGDGESRSR